MKNALTMGLGLAIGIGLVACTAAATTEEAPEVAPIVSEIPQEDDPDWNWKTHGNRTAGGTVTMFDGETFEVLVTVNSDGSYSITKK